MLRSSRIRGTSAAPAICRAWASRRSRRTSSGFAWSQGRPDNGMPREHGARASARDGRRDRRAAERRLRERLRGGRGGRRRKACGWPWRREWRDCRSRTRPAATRRPCSSSTTPWNGLRAARARDRRGGGDTLLVGRAECFLVGRPDLAEVIARLTGLRQCRRRLPVCAGTSHRGTTSRPWSRPSHPKPVNVLMGSAGGLTLAALASLGVRRVSVGGALARAAWGGFMRAAQALMRQGSLDGLAPMPTHDDLDALFQPAGRLVRSDHRPLVSVFRCLEPPRGRRNRSRSRYDGGLNNRPFSANNTNTRAVKPQR